MESTPLLGNPLPPNTHRILNIGNMHRNYATAYPAMLHRTMNEIDFVNYLKRIDEAGHASKKVLLLLVTPFALFALLALVYYIINIPSALPICWVFWLVVSAGASIYAIFSFDQKARDARTRVEAIVEEINQLFRSRGLKWEYIQGTKRTPTCIVVTLLNTDREQNTVSDPWSQMQCSGIGADNSSDTSLLSTYLPLTSTLYPSYSHPSAPPLPPSASNYTGNTTMFTVVN